jgi:hypothetical protein
MRNIIPNIINSNNNDMLNSSQHNRIINNTDEEEQELSREINGRRCGFCRMEGHTVLRCDNIEVINGRRELHDIINNNIYTSRNIVETIINEWLINKSDSLLKAIFCNKRILKFRYNYTREDIEYKIKNYINHKLYFLRLEQYRNIRNRSNISNATITILLPYRLISTLKDLYDTLSIRIVILKTKLNFLNKECPICLDHLQYHNIQKTNCSHEFCKDCLTKTIKSFVNRRNKAACPLCRSNIELIYQNKKFVNESIDRL